MKNCPNCQQPNAFDVHFCTNCGLDFAAVNFNQPPPNFQQPNFQPQPPLSHGGQMPPNSFQPPQNWQTQPHKSKPHVSGKQIALGIGGIAFGLIMLASGSLKLFNSSNKDSRPLVFTPANNSSPDNNPEILRQFTQHVTTWMRFIYKGDKTAVAEMTADDYIGIYKDTPTASGTKQEILKLTVRNDSFVSYEMQNAKLLSYTGEAATISGKEHSVYKDKILTNQAVYNFVKRNGKWLIKSVETYDVQVIPK